MEENNAAVPGMWNPGTNYADTRYQLPRIDTTIGGEGVLKGVEKLTKRGGEGGDSIRFGTVQSVHDGGEKIVGEIRYGCVHEGPEFCRGTGMIHGPRGESVFAEVALRVQCYEGLAEVLQR